MPQFNDLLLSIKNNNPKVNSIYAEDIDDADEVKYEGTSVTYPQLKKEQIKQLALALQYNIFVTTIRTGYYYPPDDLKPYIALIEAYTKRNGLIKQIEETQFKHYIKADLSKLVMRPLVIMAELGKVALSKTIGLEYIWNLVRRVGPGDYHLKLPTISFQLQQGTFIYRQITGDYSYYPTIGISSNQYSGSYLSAPLAINNYFWRNIGKLSGILITLPFTLLLVIAAIAKSIINNIQDKLKQNSELENTQISIKELLNQLPPTNENSFDLAEIYRDNNEFNIAYSKFMEVPESAENYVDAMYEAGCIAFHMTKDFTAAKTAFEKGLAAAAVKCDKNMIDQFNELLRIINANPDEILGVPEQPKKRESISETSITKFGMFSANPSPEKKEEKELSYSKS